MTSDSNWVGRSPSRHLQPPSDTRESRSAAASHSNSGSTFSPTPPSRSSSRSPPPWLLNVDSASTLPSVEDDLQLAPGALDAFRSVLEVAIPPGASFYQHPTFIEAQLPDFRGDKRWKTMYTSPILVSAVDWLGARTLLEQQSTSAQTEAAPGQFSTSYTLAQLVPRLERRFDFTLRSDLARFAGEADALAAVGAPSTLLRTPQNLALVFALLFGVSFADLQMARLSAALNFLRQLASIFGLCGLPSTLEPMEYLGGNFDDWLWDQTWISFFWATTLQMLWHANTTRTLPVFDPLQKYPLVNTQVPPYRITIIPSANNRPPNSPVPLALLDGYPFFNCRDYLSFLDPLFTPPCDPATRQVVLNECVTKLKTSGFGHLVTFLAFAAVKTLEYTKWLKEVAGLSMLEVIVATEVGPGGHDASISLFDASIDSSAAGIISRLSSNPFLDEAIRRRTFLWEVYHQLGEALPFDVKAAWHASDFDALAASVPHMSPGQFQMFVGYLANGEQGAMVIVCPEPFQDLGGLEAVSSSPTLPARPRLGSLDRTAPLDWTTVATGIAADADQSPPPRDPYEVLLSLWFRTQTFAMAARRAVRIAGASRMLVSRVSKIQLQSNLFTTTACYAASHAAWLDLLILRRFRWLLASSMETDQAKAMDLYTGLVNDVRSCLDLLKASNKPAQEAVRVLLESFLEGQDIQLSRADLQMLRMARKVASYCKHLGEDDDELDGGTSAEDGYCWICAAKRANRIANASTNKSRRSFPLSPVKLKVDDGEGGRVPSRIDSLFNYRSPSSELESSDSDDEEDPLSAIPVYQQAQLRRPSDMSDYGEITLTTSNSSPATAPKPKRRVQFNETVIVYETYSADEYPSRSKLAPDDPDLVVAPATTQSETTNVIDVLGMLLENRDVSQLPDLRNHWY